MAVNLSEFLIKRSLIGLHCLSSSKLGYFVPTLVKLGMGSCWKTCPLTELLSSTIKIIASLHSMAAVQVITLLLDAGYINRVCRSRATSRDYIHSFTDRPCIQAEAKVVVIFL